MTTPTKFSSLYGKNSSLSGRDLLHEDFGAPWSSSTVGESSLGLDALVSEPPKASLSDVKETSFALNQTVVTNTSSTYADDPGFVALATSEPTHEAPAAAGIDGFVFDAGGSEPQKVAVIAVAQIFVKVFKGMIDFMKFAKSVLVSPDTPEFSIADIVALNYGLLKEIKDDLQDVKTELDVINAQIDGLSEQFNTSLIADVTNDAFDLFDMIIELKNPSQEELNQIVTHGAELMNLALQRAEDVPNNAPAIFIAGQVAPALILATAVRVASVDYASDTGLGYASVQGDIRTAENLLNDIYSQNGPLAKQIIDEITVEQLTISGFNGGHVHQFVTIETYTGPSGAITHNVVGYHGYTRGDSVGSKTFPTIASEWGSVNGFDVDNPAEREDALQAIATLRIDHVVPFLGDNVLELEAANDWLNDNRAAAIEKFVKVELDTLGGNDLGEAIAEFPSTSGLNQYNAGGSGVDHIVGDIRTNEIYDETPDLILGGDGNDTLEGGAERDALFGEGGADNLLGGDANDKLFGGNGGDFLYGGEGHDKLQGEGGRDTLKGGNGNDVLFQSERGNFFTHQDPDNFGQVASQGGYLYGEGGNDLMVGDNGRDIIDGSTGHDTAYGYGGADEINGGDGNDELFGGAGADAINAGSGKDYVDGGEGDDEIDGSFGDDTIMGGGGDDEITGGYGVDTVVYRGRSADFSWIDNGNGSWTVTDERGANATDGVDTIFKGVAYGKQRYGYGVEYLQFDDDLVPLSPDVGSIGPRYTTELPPPPGPFSTFGAAATEDNSAPEAAKIIGVHNPQPEEIPFDTLLL